MPGEVVPTGWGSRRRLWPKPGVAEAGVSETGLEHTTEIAAPRNNGNRLASTWTFKCQVSWCQPEGVAEAGVEQTTEIVVPFAKVTG